MRKSSRFDVPDTVHCYRRNQSALLVTTHNARSGETCRRKTPGYLMLLHMTNVFRRCAASRTDRCILAVDIVSCLKQLAWNIEILIEYR